MSMMIQKIMIDDGVVLMMMMMLLLPLMMIMIMMVGVDGKIRKQIRRQKYEKSRRLCRKSYCNNETSVKKEIRGESEGNKKK